MLEQKNIDRYRGAEVFSLRRCNNALKYVKAPDNSASFFPWQAFELATGDYLFEPHSGEDYTRDEGRHLCLGHTLLSGWNLRGGFTEGLGLIFLSPGVGARIEAQIAQKYCKAVSEGEEKAC